MRPSGSPAALGLAALALLAGCSGGDADLAGSGAGAVDPDLAAAISDAGIDVYLPRLRGSVAEGTTVRGLRRDAPVVRTTFAGIEDPVMGDDTWTLSQEPTPARVTAALEDGRTPLCRVLGWEDADYGCDGGPDHAVVDYEGDTTVALVRGGTTLYGNVETESDPDMVGQMVAALRGAARISPADLSRLGG